MILTVGIDPSLKNTAVATVAVHNGHIDVNTEHIKELRPGTYTECIQRLVLCQFPTATGFRSISKHITAGFVEDFSNIGGADTNKTTIKSVSHSGGMAEEAIAALGIPMQPIEVRKWRKVVLGKAPKHPTKSGRIMSYWTKGDRPSNVPNNLTPALIRLFDPIMGLKERADFTKLNDPECNALFEEYDFEDAMRFIEDTSPSSRRIQLVFGISTDELEAAGIALAGAKLIKAGEIEGMNANT